MDNCLFRPDLNSRRCLFSQKISTKPLKLSLRPNSFFSVSLFLVKVQICTYFIRVQSRTILETFTRLGIVGEEGRVGFSWGKRKPSTGQEVRVKTQTHSDPNRRRGRNPNSSGRNRGVGTLSKPLLGHQFKFVYSLSLGGSRGTSPKTSCEERELVTQYPYTIHLDNNGFSFRVSTVSR